MKGWNIKVVNNKLYDESFCLNNIDLFDESYHPQPELITMLKYL